MAQRTLFGTDGIRGLANIPPMDAETALRVGMAAGAQFKRGSHRHKVVIGKDTRLSGYLLEPALTSGFIAVGMDVILVGPLPSPAVAMLTRSLRADLGVMISASHNPFEDNGIKLFGPDGYKLSDEKELAIERVMASDMASLLAGPAELGRAKRLENAKGRYIEYVKHTFPKGLSLEGLKIVIDCANGAAYHIGPIILQELGAEVIPFAITPDGLNINKACGSTHPETMCQRVLKHGADIGIALDGDADRLALCDERGTLIDGDQMLALIAGHLQAHGQLKTDCVVATAMSNLGLEQYLKQRGLTLMRTAVGDRYVIEAMREHGCNVGGEQSGHIILSDYSTTGDALIAALQVMAVMAESQAKASDVLHIFDPLPQILRNVRFNGKDPLESSEVRRAIADGENRLKDTGRIFIRKSGTEPLIRVMVEGADQALIANVAQTIATEIETAAE